MNYTALEAIATATGTIITLAGVYAAYRIARRADALNESTRDVARIATLQDWRRDVREWAAEVIDEMSQVEQAHAEASDRPVATYRLSALLDRGRHFFINERRDEHGVEKESAYRGWRHAALDPIEAAIGVASLTRGLGKHRTASDALQSMRRHFVSRLQDVLAVEEQTNQIAVLIRATSRSGDPTLGGLLPSPTSIPAGADGLLGGAQRYLRKERSMPEETG